VDWKAVDVVIQALKDCPGLTLEVIGDGPMLEPWRTLAGQLGVAARVQFAGWLSQNECAARILTATALVLPSIYECGGAVVLEAMAMGKPVIASNWGGPADYLDASCGILIEPASHDALVKGFADAMQLLADSPAIARSMGAAGRERVAREFDWQKKIDKVIEIYTELAEQALASVTSKDAAMKNAPV
jgi:glycosyltransferase involved in cell wall biosynthesis